MERSQIVGCLFHGAFVPIEGFVFSSELELCVGAEVPRPRVIGVELQVPFGDSQTPLPIPVQPPIIAEIQRYLC